MRAHLTGEHIVQITQTRQRSVKDMHLGPHTGGNARGVGADDPAADHHDLGGRNTGHSSGRNSGCRSGRKTGHHRCRESNAISLIDDR